MKDSIRFGNSALYKYLEVFHVSIPQILLVLTIKKELCVGFKMWYSNINSDNKSFELKQKLLISSDYIIGINTASTHF